MQPAKFKKKEVRELKQVFDEHDKVIQPDCIASYHCTNNSCISTYLTGLGRRKAMAAV